MRRSHLSDEELAAYDHIPVELARRVVLWELPRVPGQFAGITLGRHVLTSGRKDRTGRSMLIAHELVHVRQWAELGVIGFAARYLAGFVAGLRAERRWMPAYRAIPAEVEARELATAWRVRTQGHRGTPAAGDATA